MQDDLRSKKKEQNNGMESSKQQPDLTSMYVEATRNASLREMIPDMTNRCTSMHFSTNLRAHEDTCYSARSFWGVALL